MSSKIVYLFGAGASFNAIPVVSGMKYRLVAFLKYFENKMHLKTSDDPFPGNRTGQLNVLDLYKNIINETAQSFSIDTLSRKSYLRSELPKLDAIKGIIAAYLLWEQIVVKDGLERIYIPSTNAKRYSPSTNYCNYKWQGTYDEALDLSELDIQLSNYDYRYESLLSVLAIERNKFNPNVSFISWNYDNQMEIAVDRVFNIEGDEETRNRLLDKILGKNFIKLNGSAGLSNFDWEPVSRFRANRDQRLQEIADFLVGKENFPNRIKFAWEEDSELPRKRVLEHLNEAEELVIIGYSFPDYNRKVDFEMLSEFWRKSPMKRITVQDTAENADKVAQRIKSMTRSSEQADRIKVYTETQQFYIPPIYLAG